MSAPGPSGPLVSRTDGNGILGGPGIPNQPDINMTCPTAVGPMALAKPILDQLLRFLVFIEKASVYPCQSLRCLRNSVH